ncbi:MAG: hypothetical protein K0R08_1789 [Solimicrobium sp.]|nr:hypothetical protein [Solimicrobium sp.]
MKRIYLVNSFSKESTRSFRQRSASFATSLIQLVFIGLIGCGAMVNATASEGIIYVNSAAALTGDGQKWETAYNNIDDALTESVYIKWYAKDYKGTSIMPATTVQVWVATGRYTMLKNLKGVFDKVDIYGGFLGSETSVNDRLFDTNHLPLWPTTILDNPWNI